uniref:Putative trans-golgi network integral membrane protein tgn38 n=1 Tax=Phlebotomus kandelakii TaxID=1109342 RepID=A0A6B2EHM5_9DIPT
MFPGLTSNTRDMWTLLLVLVSAVFTAKCAPLQGKSSRPNPLQDPALLPVLAQCNRYQEDKTLGQLCGLYWAVVQNDSATQNVTQEFEAVLALPEANVVNFCGRLLHFQGVQGYLKSMKVCELRCKDIDDDEVTFTKPLCRLILWRLEVQRAGQVSPPVGEITAPAATQEVAPTAQRTNVSTTVGNMTSQVQEASQKPMVTPSGGSNKVEIPPMAAQKPSTLGTSSTKALEEVPNKPLEEPKVVEKVKEEPPGVVKPPPAAPGNKQPSPEAPKPPEEVKKQPEVQPDVEEDPNENLKDMEDDDTPDDYTNVEEGAAKGDMGQLEAGDAGLIFDKSESKDTPPGNKIEVVDAKKDPFKDEAESNFFIYFLCLMVVCVLVYVVYHNKSKVLALVLEGRRSSQGRGRRKHTAAYRKLDSNLEEAIASSAASRTSQIIY